MFLETINLKKVGVKTIIVQVNKYEKSPLSVSLYFNTKLITLIKIAIMTCSRRH